MVGKRTAFGSQISPFIADFSGISLISVIWLVLPNRAFSWVFLSCSLHASLVKSFSSLYFSLTSLFWVFLSSVCFFSLSFVLCFCKSTFIWFSLHTACLLTSEYFVWNFWSFCKKRVILFVTFFVLDWLQSFCCLWPCLGLSLDTRALFSFYEKQHLICTDQMCLLHMRKLLLSKLVKVTLGRTFA